eukprot:10386795-Lingulodinium_polyedra.AAC.1
MVGTALASIVRDVWVPSLHCLNRDSIRPIVSRAGWFAIRPGFAAANSLSPVTRMRSLAGADRMA